MRAVGQDDNVLDILVQSQRHKKAVEKVFKKPLKGLQDMPRELVTDQRQNYAAALAQGPRRRTETIR